MIWIPVTLLASALQIARTSEQHRLRSALDVVEAGYVRFAYACPLAVVLLVAWTGVGPGGVPEPNPRFVLSAVLGGGAQILATMALLQAFRDRDFAVGTVFAKTEVLFVAAGSTVLLGEPLSWLGWVGAAVCLAGVTYLATAGAARAEVLGRFDRAAGFGMLAGLGFALAAIGIRSASSALDGDAVDRAALTLVTILVFQTVAQGAVIARSPTSSLARVAGAWRQAWPVAVLSLAGSAAWALAITLENAAKVRTLGQIEIVLAFVIGVAVHGERHTRPEYLAGIVTAIGIGLIVLT